MVSFVASYTMPETAKWAAKEQRTIRNKPQHKELNDWAFIQNQERRFLFVNFTFKNERYDAWAEIRSNENNSAVTNKIVQMLSASYWVRTRKLLLEPTEFYDLPVTDWNGILFDWRTYPPLSLANAIAGPSRSLPRKP